jgi:TonB family protein
MGPTWGDMREASPYAASSSSVLYDESTVWVRVALDARGYVTDARVERSLQRPIIENRLLSYVRTISFFPAMEDGYPVPGQLSLPMHVGRR